ncbi:hypothetical protein [Sphingomonas sp.]|uniref:hypothetical protein n=1 Tax=Sphingomonas sp. TaxID=28214 RepID=UPI0035C8030F
MTDQPSKENQSDSFSDAAKRSQDAGIADESAAYQNATVPTEGGKPAEDSEAHPS